MRSRDVAPWVLLIILAACQPQESPKTYYKCGPYYIDQVAESNTARFRTRCGYHNMKSVESASGTKYEYMPKKGNPVTFWTKGYEATLYNGKKPYVCTRTAQEI